MRLRIVQPAVVPLLLFVLAPAPIRRGATPDPHGFPLSPTGQLKGTAGSVSLVPAPSPFGIAVTADGHTTYDLTISVSGLPDPRSLGDYAAYVAWIMTPDLGEVRNLGAVTAGAPVLRAQTSLNKFLVVITAERSAGAARRTGPTLLTGRSPSALMQSFLDHPFYNTGLPP